jgi:hypothetical protein
MIGLSQDAIEFLVCFHLGIALCYSHGGRFSSSNKVWFLDGRQGRD